MPWDLYSVFNLKRVIFFKFLTSCEEKSANFQAVYMLDWQLWVGSLFIFEAFYNDLVIQHIQQIFAGSKPKRRKEGNTKLGDYSLKNIRLVSNCILRKGALFFVPDYVVFFLLFCLLWQELSTCPNFFTHDQIPPSQLTP